MADLPNIRSISNDFSSPRGQINVPLNSASARRSTDFVGSNSNRPAGRAGDLRQAVNQYVAKNSTANILQFPLDRPKFYTQIQLARYSRQDLLRIGDLSVESTILLPLPLNLVDNHGVSYSEEPIGQGVGTAAQLVLPKVNQESQLATTVGISAIKAASDASGLSSVAEGISNVAQGPLTQAIGGFAPNQFFTVLLKGPQYKRHTLNWNLYPRNFRESDHIREIIRTMNNAMAPTIHLGGAIFGFPMLFNIALLPNYRYLYRFKPAVLAEFGVNYTPNQMPAFYAPEQGSSPPEAVSITAVFIELEFWLRGDFMEAGGPYDVTASDRSGGGTAPVKVGQIEEIGQSVVDNVQNSLGSINKINEAFQKWLKGANSKPGGS